MRCEDGLEKLEDNSIDLTVTSPPYDNLRENEEYNAVFDFKKVANELYRVTKEGGVVVWVVGDQTVDGSETGTSFKQALYFKEQAGFNLHDTMIYRKSGFPFPEKTRYNPVFEYMFVLSKGKPKNVNLIKDKRNKYSGGKVARKKSDRQPDGSLKANSAYKNNPNKKV